MLSNQRSPIDLNPIKAPSSQTRSDLVIRPVILEARRTSGKQQAAPEGSERRAYKEVRVSIPP